MKPTSQVRSVRTLGQIIVSVLEGSILLGSLLMVVCLGLSSRSWIADLVVMVLGPGWIVLGGVLGLAVLAIPGRKRWRCALGVVVLGSSLTFAWVGWSGRRLMPVPRDPVARAHESAGVVRIIQVNFNGRGSKKHAEALEAVAASGADVVVVTEFPSMIWEQLRTESALSRAYPNFTYRDWVKNKVPGCLVLSRWPIEKFKAPEGLDHEQVFVGRVETPWGQLVVSQIAPQSPRTGQRWSRGNEIVDAAARVLGPMSKTQAVVLGCDLNGTAFGSRGRTLRSAGLAPGKAAWSVDGTWPAVMPGVARLVLDDVWVGRGVEVDFWRTASVPGSDHRWTEVGVRVGKMGSGIQEAGDSSQPGRGSDR